jgi:hypothetical protein
MRWRGERKEKIELPNFEKKIGQFLFLVSKSETRSGTIAPPAIAGMSGDMARRQDTASTLLA